MGKIDDFKSFVKTKPELISYVNNGTTNWQSLYEVWDLYGPEHEEWNKYKKQEASNSNAIKQEAIAGLTDIFSALKKVDLEAVRTNINGIQKAIGLIQEITNKNGSPKIDAKEPYSPRPIYRRFED